MKKLHRTTGWTVLLVFSLIFSLPVQGAKTSAKVLPADLQGMSAERLARIDGLLSQAVEQQRVKGMVALVARNGKVVYHKAFGQMDEGKAMQKDAIFRICSMSKPITAVAVMMLWEKGVIELNDPIAKYIPEFKEVKVLQMDPREEKGYRMIHPKQPITIRHLLSHTSGISYGFWGQAFIADCYLENKVSDGLTVTEWTLGENIQRLAKCPILFHPGEAWEYGLSSDVLGYLVEVVSGMPFDKFLQENLFGPLKMKDTFFVAPKEKQGRLATVYEPVAGGGLGKLNRKVVERGALSKTKSLIYDPFYSTDGAHKYLSGGAGLHSTVEDYFRFCQMLLNGGKLENVRILSPTTVDLMTNTFMGDFKMWWIPEGGMKYALGVMTITDRQSSANSLPNGSYYWGGFYHTRFYVDPKHNLIALYFSQIRPYAQVDDVPRKFFNLTQQAVEK